MDVEPLNSSFVRRQQITLVGIDSDHTSGIML
jgi:hypothetical protein